MVQDLRQFTVPSWAGATSKAIVDVGGQSIVRECKKIGKYRLDLTRVIGADSIHNQVTHFRDLT